jgi:hypothetical protein
LMVAGCLANDRARAHQIIGEAGAEIEEGAGERPPPRHKRTM